MHDTDQPEPFADLDVLAGEYALASRHADEPRQRRLRGDFVREALPFARRLARRYRGRGEPLDDLEQVARLGLVKTVDRFDPGRGSFTAYAILTITGELKRHFRDHTWGVHVPRGQQDRVLEMVHTREVLTTELSRAPTVGELAERLGLGTDEVLGTQTSAAAHLTESLNIPVGDSPDGTERGDLLGGLDHELSLVDDRTTVAALLCELPTRERRLLALRFWGNLNQAEIADQLGISQMHVSRLLSRTLTWLREALLSDTPAPWAGSGLPEHRVFSRPVADGIRAVVHGEIDRDNAHQVRRELLSAVAGCGRGRRLTVDLAGVPLLCAAGIDMLTVVHEMGREHGVKVLFTAVQPFVRRVLVIAGLRHLLEPAAQ